MNGIINRLEQQLQNNNDRNERSVVPYGSNDVYDNSNIDFELSLPFEDMQNHIKSLYNENKGLGIVVLFNGRLNLKTGKVVAVSIGKCALKNQNK